MVEKGVNEGIDAIHGAFGLILGVSFGIHSDEHITWLRGWPGPLEDYFPLQTVGAIHFHVSESECILRF